MPPHTPASKAAAQDDDPGALLVVPMAAPKAVEHAERGLLVPSRRGVEIAADLQNAVSAWSAKPRERGDGPQRATMEEAAQAERHVHVTIGRIEVRAASGEKAPARERPVSPVMGLDEYLRRQVRRGGQ